MALPHTAGCILLAEDDHDLRMLMANALASDDYSVVQFANGNELVDHLRALGPDSTFPDAIVTDIRMPGMSGLRAVALLREAAWDIPVVVVSAFADPRARTEALHLGVNAVIDKPCDARELRDVVARLLDNAIGVPRHVWAYSARAERRGYSEAPTAPPVELPSAPADAAQGQVAESARRACVLVVDGDPQVLRTAARALAQDDLEVLTAGNAPAAFALLAAAAIDVVVTDSEMPVLDGVDLAREVRARHPDVAVVLMSGAIDLDEATRSHDRASYRALQEPISGVALRSEVRRALARSK